LAAALLNGKMSYPSFVLMNEDLEILQPLPGYKTADELEPILTYISEDHYLSTKWEDYKKAN